MPFASARTAPPPPQVSFRAQPRNPRISLSPLPYPLSFRSKAEESAVAFRKCPHCTRHHPKCHSERSRGTPVFRFCRCLTVCHPAAKPRNLLLPPPSTVCHSAAQRRNLRLPFANARTAPTTTKVSFRAKPRNPRISLLPLPYRLSSRSKAKESASALHPYRMYRLKS